MKKNLNIKKLLSDLTSSQCDVRRNAYDLLAYEIMNRNNWVPMTFINWCRKDLDGNYIYDSQEFYCAVEQLMEQNNYSSEKIISVAFNQRCPVLMPKILLTRSRFSAQDYQNIFENFLSLRPNKYRNETLLILTQKYTENITLSEENKDIVSKLFKHGLELKTPYCIGFESAFTNMVNQNMKKASLTELNYFIQNFEFISQGLDINQKAIKLKKLINAVSAHKNKLMESINQISKLLFDYSCSGDKHTRRKCFIGFAALSQKTIPGIAAHLQLKTLTNLCLVMIDTVTFHLQEPDCDDNLINDYSRLLAQAFKYMKKYEASKEKEYIKCTFRFYRKIMCIFSLGDNKADRFSMELFGKLIKYQDPLIYLLEKHSEKCFSEFLVSELGNPQAKRKQQPFKLIKNFYTEFYIEFRKAVSRIQKNNAIA